jgi:branched-chain amino acid transport system ATP-binding protein
LTGYFSISGMSQSFGGIVALDDVSVSVAKGEVFGVIGPNGAGKTTLLNCICGVYVPDRGQLLLDGADLTGKRPHRIAEAGIARTFQHADFFAAMPVTDFLLLSRLRYQTTSLTATALGLRGARRSERAERERAWEMLERFGLEQAGRSVLGSLPYGTRKLLDICRALLTEPSVLLMDEPTSGTAAADRELLRRIVGQLRDDGLTTVVVDHDVAFITDVCDRLLAMNFGRQLAVGEPHEVLARPDVIESYVGLESAGS